MDGFGGDFMDNFLHIAALWLHILGIALFVGPQFFLALAWVPASRGIADMPTRVTAMRTITRRFGYIGGAGLGMILVAGTYLVATWRDYYAQPDDVGFNELRYGVIFSIKMTVLLVMLIVTGLHMFVVGPEQLGKLDAQARGERVSDAEVRSTRRQSMMLSMTGLLLTLVIMVFGVMLTTATFSMERF
jgi:uncharacterized membrane protein